MRFLSWFAGLKLDSSRRRTKRGKVRGPRRQPAGVKLSVEALEDRVMPALVSWVGGSGDWNTVANWRDDALVNRLPGPGDDAVIKVAGISVTHSSGAHTVKALTIDDPFTLSGGTLTVTGNLVQQHANTFTMTGGTLKGAKVVAEGGAVLVAANATLDGVTLGATVGGVLFSGNVQVNDGAITVTGGLTFANGSLLDLGNFMTLVGAQTMGGDGEIRFRSVGGSGGQINTSNQTTFGPGLTIDRVDTATSAIYMNGGGITNQGTIRANAGGKIRVTGNAGTTFTNAVGGVLAADGGTLDLTTAWSNAGQIVVNNSTLNLGGSFTTVGLGTYTRTRGTINLVGLLDNTGRTFSLDATTGSWNLGANGTLRRGSLVTSGGAVLVVADNSTLDGATLGATVGGVPASAIVQSSGNFFVTGGLTFANGSVVNVSNNQMSLVGDQTVGGAGEIRLGGFLGNIATFNQTTFGPGLTIHRADTSPSVISMVNGSITNQATIRADAGGQITVGGNAGTTFTNAANGVVAAAAGGTLIIAPVSWTNIGTTSVVGGTLTIAPVSWTNTGTVTMDNSTVNLGGTWSNTGAFQVTGGTVNLGGTWSNTGTFQVTGSTLNLGGSFTTAGMGALTIDRRSVVNLTGTLNNTGSTLALDNATGSWNLVGGTIVGGRVSTAGSAALVAGVTEGTLNGVTLAGTLTGGRIAFTGGLKLEQGLIDCILVLFNGTQTLGGAGAVVFSTNNANNDVRVSANATLTVGPGITIHGVTGFIGSTSSGRILNQGTIAADGGGTLTVQGISNFASGTLTGGTWQVSGTSTLRLIGAAISTNAADILRDGASARLLSDSGSTNALAGLAANTAAGRLRLQNGATLTTSAGNVNNQGSLTVGPGSTFTVSGDYLATGDTTVDGSLIANSVTVDQAGTLAGSGTVTGNVVNNGQVRPGTSPGNLSVNGSYTQGGTGRLDIEIGGTTAGSQYDRLSISGPATLNGKLAVRLVNGFGPTTGQRFEVMTFAGHTGAFSAVTGLSQGRFPLFSLTVNAANVELNALANGTDLAFDSFQSATFPHNAMPGQNVTVTYTVKNLSAPSADGNWIDSIYLSRDGVLDPSDALLTRVEHRGGVAGLGSYTETATAPLPALADAGYRVIVVVDSRGLVSDADRSNNTGVSAQGISVTVPLLTLGTPVSGSIAPGQDLYYRVLVAPGANVTVAADFAAPPGAEVFIRYRALPDRTNFDDASPTGHLHPRLLLTNPQGGTHYLQLHGREDAAGAVAFTLKADTSGFEITQVSPLRGSNLAQPAIIDFRGSNFTPRTQIQLRMPGGESRTAKSVQFVNANRIVATVDLAGLPAGTYQIVVEDAGKTAIAFDTFTVTSNAPGKTGAFIYLKVKIFDEKSFVGVRTISYSIGFGEFNTSDSPLPAPLYVLRATNVQPGQEEQGFLGSDTVPPRLLPGDYSNHDVQTVVYKPAVTGPGVKSTYSLFVIEPTQTSMDWDKQKESLRPMTIPPDAWDAVWANLRPQLGETLSDFWRILTTDSEKLAESGARVVAISDLFKFELQKANNMPAVPVPAAALDVAFPAPGLPLVFGRSLGETLTGRYRQGRLGRGWTDNFDISILEDATTGTATLSQGSIVRFFGRRPDGSYEGIPGDFGVLSKVNGTFQLRETTGEVTSFRADGLLDFVQDTNGNRISAGYSGTQLTSLTHSNGAALTLAYNGQGRIRQVTDPAGGVATYEYDASGQHLIRVTTTAGTTEYVYTADATGPRAHALASITFLDGTHLFFDYDSKGRLARQQGDGGAETFGFAYDTASFSVTDAHGQVTTFLYDDSFRIRKVRDPLGHLSYIDYDASNNPVIIGAAGGGEANFAYDALGNPTVAQNPIGETQTFAYEPGHSRLVTWQDALGHDTQFNRDPNGNLLTTTYVDGSTKKYAYDAHGNVVAAVNRLGQVIQFTYNSRGQVTRKNLPNGTHVDYTYNARGNPETVVNASGTMRLEYLDPQNPDIVTKITYPTGRFLEYTYQNGRRTRMADQSGFAVNYHYDAAGRLDFVRDAAGGLIVEYDYDEAGRLIRETHGNFTVTKYTYDNAGQLLEITHRAPDASIQSQFVYAYDNLGRRTSVTTLEGVTTYGHDGAGRLTSVTLPNGRVFVYAYDAAGNRTVAGDNSATYTVNKLNQYVAFGSTTQTFDAAGNLASSSDPAGSKSYGYDAEGRLVSQITPAGTWTYEYDVLGDRIAETHNGARTEYLVDPFGLGNVVGEYDGAGNLQAHYVHGLGLTSRVDVAGPAAFYQFDAVGNTTQLTGTGGVVLNAYSYLPFGESLATSESVANPFEYVGQLGVMREGSGLDYMRNRWYAPTQGRFTQADPIGLTGGTNFYAYAGNDPGTFVDPSGLVLDVAITAGVRLATGAFLGQSSGVAVNTLSASATQTTFADSAATQALHAEIRATAAKNAADATVREATKEAATRAAAARAVGRVGLYALIAAELTAFFLASQALVQTEASLISGHELGCTPGIPESVQVCDPKINFFTGEHIQTLTVEQPGRLSRDPNDIVGPAGFGPAGFVIPQPPLSYLIRFQNLPAAEGPAEEVVVTHVLNANLDLDTFQLDQFGFGDITVTVPAGRQFYSTRLDLRSTRGVFVDVTARLDRVTRTVTWRLQAIDPETLDLPVSPFVGFLPPDKVAPQGEGFVSFSIRAKPDLPTGTRIDARATIVFDTNAPINTNIAVNTIDAGPPTSSVLPLPAASLPTFTVRWSGNDDLAGSGIASYDVFVADNGGPSIRWQNSTAQTSASFTGQDGHSYAFYSVAVDGVGNRQAAGQAQASTRVDGASPTSSVQPLASFSPPTFTVTWSGADNAGGSGIRTYDVFVATDGGPFMPFLFGTPATSAAFTGAGGHGYAFYSVATDNVGNRQAAPAGPQAMTTIRMPQSPPQPLSVVLVQVPQGKGTRKTKKLYVRVLLSDGTIRLVVSPFQKSAFSHIVAALRDANGDGILDSILITGRKGKKPVRAFVTL